MVCRVWEAAVQGGRFAILLLAFVPVVVPQPPAQRSPSRPPWREGLRGVREEVQTEAQRCQDVLAEVQAEEIPQGSQSMTLTIMVIFVMTTMILVIMTTTIPRIAQAFMSASRREILGSRGRSKSQQPVSHP